jgi:hypothetical protein
MRSLAAAHKLSQRMSLGGSLAAGFDCSEIEYLCIKH